MSEIKDGGPAFPRVPISGDAAKYSGMSLRDYFAAKALAGIASTLTMNDVSDLANDVIPGDMRALACYQLADAMLAAREAK